MASTYYLRVCPECGDSKEVTYRPKKDTLCISCRSKQPRPHLIKANTKDPGTHIRYWYFCPHCPDVKQVKSKRKSVACGHCNRRHNSRIPEDRYVFDLEKMIIQCIPKKRHFRICPDCPEDSNTIQVASAINSGIKMCVKCAVKYKKPRAKKPKKKKVKTYKQIGIDGQQKVNIRKPKVKYQVVDEKTMEAPVKKRDIEYPALDEAESKRMQEEFLRGKR